MKEKPISKVYIDLIVIAIGFAGLSYIFKFPYLACISLLAIFSSVNSYLARWVSNNWELFGKFLGKVNTTILLAVFYFGVITPISLVYRLFHKSGPSHTGRWVNSTNLKNDFTKPW